MLTMGYLAYDGGEGEVLVGPRGIEVAWKETSNETEARWSQAGGCRMADDGEAKGVVNALGESFRNPNLFANDLIHGQSTTSLKDRLQH